MSGVLPIGSMRSLSCLYQTADVETWRLLFAFHERSDTPYQQADDDQDDDDDAANNKKFDTHRCPLLAVEP